MRSALVFKAGRFVAKARIFMFGAFWHTNCQRYFELLPPTATASPKGAFPVTSTQLTIDEIRTVARRRWKFLVFPSLTVIILSVVGAFTLPRRYVSTTQILVQRDEILNPLVSFSMAVALVSEDRLRTFNEIIFSRRTAEMLIDTLNLGKGARSRTERDALIKAVRRNIDIDRRGSDSFTISYTDSDPVRAQRAASLIADYFIRTNTEVETRRNNLSVQFFEKKLEDYRVKFEASQKAFVSVLVQRLDTLPTEWQSLRRELEETNKRVNEVDKRAQSYEDALAILRMFPDSLHTENGRQALFDLQRVDIPYASDLHGLLAKYEEFTQRYTLKYPEVEKLEEQILDLLGRIRLSVESEIAKQQNVRWELEGKAVRIVNELKRSSVLQKVDEDKESDYNIYRKLYDDMKMKLEQARTTLDLGARGAGQYIILDPAPLPTTPTKPNRALMILGGFGLGLLLGILSAIAAELFDTTVRAPVDIERYHKPIIAFIPYAEYKEITD
jgi:succinoglycan biosynthesis transport protein ExoP